MTDPTTPELLDHNYDGIQEYDNPLPGWWSALFILSVVFAAFYLVHYHLGGEGVTLQEEYEDEAAAVFELRFAELGELQPTRETLLEYKDDPEWLTVGAAVFKTHCVSCHAAGGTGDVGPNLTDDYWKNVTAIEDIAKVIAEGAGKGSMPSWRNRLSHINQIVLTAAYVASLRGTASGGKAPEGAEIPPWSEAK